LINALVKEPVIQFLMIGALLFGAYGLWGPDEEGVAKQRIVIDEAAIESLEASFEATWKRPPTAEERQGLIEDRLAEEILYREAQKLGLDRDDVVIRRRMRQKMEFLLQDTLADPDEAALRAYFEANAERYAEGARYGFTQLYLGVETSTAQSEDWQALSDRLNSGAPVQLEEVAQPTLLPERMTPSEASAIDRVFGTGFAASLSGLEQGAWSEPVESAYGWHLVRLDQRTDGATPDFEAARALVERDLLYERRQEARAALIDRLGENYEIVVESPQT
jgi:peptidyl-prolyl cis-trans isomerase C